MKMLLTLLALSAACPAFSEVIPQQGKDFTNSLGMKMIWVEGFWVGEKEVTQKQLTTLGVADTSTWRKGEADAPANNVVLADALKFCSALNTQDKDQLPEGCSYSLPTIKQWRSIKNPAVKDLQGSVSEWTRDKFTAETAKLNDAAGISDALNFPRTASPRLFCVLGASWKSATSKFANGICPVDIAAKGIQTGRASDDTFRSSSTIGTRLSAGEIGFRVVLLPPFQLTFNSSSPP